MPSAVPFTDPAQHLNALHTVVVSRKSKDSSIRDNPELLQFHTETSNIDNVTERYNVISMYPYTELLLQMSVDANRRSALHKSNRDHNLANLEFPIHSIVMLLSNRPALFSSAPACSTKHLSPDCKRRQFHRSVTLREP